LLLKFKF